jgi:hypothetical protein
MSNGWRPANYGNGRRMWFVSRDVNGQPEYLLTKDGQLVRFARFETAKKRADKLNAIKR